MGLETVLKFELYDLGYKELLINNGLISLNGTIDDVIELNLWLRTAGRVFIDVASFNAHTFDDLFDAVQSVDWTPWLNKTSKITIDSVTTKDSDLFSKSDIQSIVKKSIITSLQNHYRTKIIDESGEHIPIRIHAVNNQFTLRLDTSGHGLNKRGYRTRFDAPLRETLAAGMIKLSRWDPANDALIDPCCGSGTILIEAAMIANNIAPGLNQSFISEEWCIFTPSAWKNARESAVASQQHIPYRIYGSDINPQILKTTRYNINRARLDNIFVETKCISNLRSRFEQGKIISNPPYGIRLEDQGATHKLYNQMGYQFNTYFKDWHYYILSGDEQFEEYFNQKSTRKRKLFNGNIRCYLHQYF